MNFQSGEKSRFENPLTEPQNSPKGYGSSVISDVIPGHQ